jgi:hypothetical protein
LKAGIDCRKILEYKILYFKSKMKFSNFIAIATYTKAALIPQWQATAAELNPTTGPIVDELVSEENIRNACYLCDRSTLRSMGITTPKTTMAPDMSKAWIYRTAPSYSVHRTAPSYHRTLPQDDTRTIVDKSVSEEIIRYPCDLCDQSTLRPTAVVAGITKTNTTAAPSASIDFQTTADVYTDEDFGLVTTPEPPFRSDLFTSTEIVQQDTTIETTVGSKYLEQTFTESTESTESTKSTATVVIEIIAFEENNPDETESTKTIFEKVFDAISYPIELVGSFFRNLFGY